MDVEAVVDLSVPALSVYAELKDLDRYPRWLSIVGAAERAGPGPAWLVDLRAGVGPLRRAKRLRMVRTVSEAPRLVRFERAELDERSHSEWILSAVIDAADPATAPSRLTMQLHYGGRLRLPLVELALREEIRRAVPRLQRVLERAEPPVH